MQLNGTLQTNLSPSGMPDKRDALFDNSVCPVIFTGHFKQPGGLHYREWLLSGGAAANGGC